MGSVAPFSPMHSDDRLEMLDPGLQEIPNLPQRYLEKRYETGL
jgi:hypothetical protein